eukprot:6188485-Pleurochrysis_carterae.AAC.2
MSQTCQYRHCPNQLLVAHTGSATGSNHSLYGPVVCKVLSSMHDHVGQIKSPGVRHEVAPGLSWDASVALRCVVSLYATNTAVQSNLKTASFFASVAEHLVSKASNKKSNILQTVCARSTLNVM